MLRFVNFQTPASVGTMVFNLVTFDADTNVNLTFTVSATAAQTENQIAYLAQQSFNTGLTTAGLNFSQPVFYDQQPTADARVTRTEHCLAVFSEAQFELTLVSNTTGSKVIIGSNPILATNADFAARASFLDVGTINATGGALSNDEIALILNMSSAEITTILKNNIVSATYIYEEITNYTTSIFLPKLPLITVDRAMIRQPGFPLLVLGMEDLQSNYAVDRQSGEMTYRFSQNLLYYYEPFDLNNDFKVSYTAGYKAIPNEIKDIAIQLISYLPIEDFKSFREGTFAIEKFGNRSQLLKQILSSVRTYFLS